SGHDGSGRERARPHGQRHGRGGSAIPAALSMLEPASTSASLTSASLPAPPAASLDPVAELLPSGTRMQLRLTFLSLLLVGLLTTLSSLLVRGVFASITPSLTADLRWKAQ